MARSRSFVFTWNNYTPETEVLLNAIKCKYMLYGREIGAGGTPHLQGLVIFENAKSFKSVAKLLPCAHIEICKDVFASVVYCKKDGDWFEEGVAPVSKIDQGEMEKDRYRAAIVLARLGDFESIPADLYTRFSGFYKKEYFGFRKSQISKWVVLDNHWFYGPSGSGKSRHARDTYPDAYIKMRNKWWDDYEFQDVVIIDDVDPSMEAWLGAFLKDWGDHYAFRCEIKGASTMIRPKTVVVTSQYQICDVFKDPETVSALNRRYVCKAFGLHSFNPLINGDSYP